MLSPGSRIRQKVKVSRGLVGSQLNAASTNQKAGNLGRTDKQADKQADKQTELTVYIELLRN